MLILPSYGLFGLKKSEENGNQDALSLQVGVDKMMQMFSRIHGCRSSINHQICIFLYIGCLYPKARLINGSVVLGDI